MSPALAGGFLTTVPPGKPPAPLVEETVLSPLNGLETPVKNQLTIDVWVYFCTNRINQFYSIDPYVCLYASTTLF